MDERLPVEFLRAVKEISMGARGPQARDVS